MHTSLVEGEQLVERVAAVFYFFCPFIKTSNSGPDAISHRIYILEFPSTYL